MTSPMPNASIAAYFCRAPRPLTASESIDQELLQLISRRISAPLPSLSLAIPRTLSAACLPSIQSPSTTSIAYLKPSASLHDMLPPTSSSDKPLPALPAKSVIALLDLMDRINADMAAEVQKVRGGIKEAQSLVRSVQQERTHYRKELKHKNDTADQSPPTAQLVPSNFSDVQSL